MKRILFIVFCLFVFSVVPSLATPPVSISLSYDLDKGSLHVEAVHPTPDLETSYVRQMVVSVNGQVVSTLDYSRQTAYDKFTDDVSLTAQIGDVIKVDLFCAEGGEMAQELTVTKPGATSPDQSSEAGGG